MPSHNWQNTVPSRCARCGATRVAARPFDRPVAPYDYSLPDGLGALDKRPACGKGTESRHSRRAGRRAKVLARSRAGSPRLKSKEAALAKVGAVVRGLAALAVQEPTPDVSTPEAPGASTGL